MLVAPFSLYEVANGISKSPHLMAPGPDGISFELLQMHQKCLAPHLVHIFNELFASASFLPGSGHSIAALIHKNYERDRLANWQPIALLNYDHKLYTKLPATRMSTWVVPCLNLCQHVFIPGKSLWDNFNKANVTLLSLSGFSSGYLYFFYIEKAYDRVSWPYLREALNCLQMPPPMTSTVLGLYHELSTSVLTSQGFHLQDFDVSGPLTGRPFEPYFA